MALAIDSSTPAPHPINWTIEQPSGIQPAVFSPPAGSVIFVFFSISVALPDRQDIYGMTDSLTTSLNWQPYEGALDCISTATAPALYGATTVWWAYCPSAQTNMSIAAYPVNDLSSNDPSGLAQVVVFTGASPYQIGNVAVRRSRAAGTASLSLTTTYDNSWVFGVVSNYKNATGPTVGANQTTTINGASSVVTNSTDGLAYWVQRQNSITPSAGTSVTLNDTAPTSMKHHFSMVEVLPAGIVVPTQPILINAYDVGNNAAGDGTVTTTAFTPVTGDLIVIKATTSDGASPLATPTATGGGISWTKQVERTTSLYCYVVIWTGTVTAGSPSITVSMATVGAPLDMMMLVEHWRCAQLAATPAITSTSGAASAPIATITTTANNSVVSWISAAPVISSIDLFNFRTHAATPEAQYTFFDLSATTAYQSAPNLGSQTLGLTTPDGQDYSLIGIELQFLPLFQTPLPWMYV